MSRSMKTLAVASVLLFGTAVSGAAFAECGGAHQTKKDTTAMETGGTSVPTKQEKG